MTTPATTPAATPLHEPSDAAVTAFFTTAMADLSLPGLYTSTTAGSQTKTTTSTTKATVVSETIFEGRPEDNTTEEDSSVELFEEEGDKPADKPAKPAAKPVAPKPAVTEPHKAHKCNQCNFSSQTEAGLKIHVGKSHKRLQPTPAPVATPAPAPRKIMAPTKTMYYQPRDTQPAHVPPSPPCGKCGSETTWSASRTNHNKSSKITTYGCHKS